MKKLFVLFISIVCMVTVVGCDQPGSSGCGGQPEAALTVTGPITGGNGKAWSMMANLDYYGYTEEEFFFEGQATAYESQGETTNDGKWSLEESTKAPYKTRMLVRKPADASKFNGTVIVEWLNVSAGYDAEFGFVYTSLEIAREGYVWIGVSAQRVGVEGGGVSLAGGDLKPLKEFDPERYGSLSHPGDAYCYDIFTQAAKVVRGAGGVDVLGGLKPKRLIAYGESQSAMYMAAYTNGVQPLAKAFDGIFIHSRMAAVPAFTGGGGGGCNAMMGAQGVKIRNDLEAKVFQFQTETDVLGAAGTHAVRQSDTDRLRTWEVAGTSHVDFYSLEFEGAINEAVVNNPVDVCQSINRGPHHLVNKAALHALNLWISGGIPPATAQPLATDEKGSAVTDEHGNTRGGVRTPLVDVPIATLKSQGAAREGGEGGGGCDMSTIMCAMFGQTIPFSPEKLLSLYPTHEDYVAKFQASAQATREAGFILAPEEQRIISEAQAAKIPF
jgi:hypothetical protein